MCAGYKISCFFFLFLFLGVFSDLRENIETKWNIEVEKVSYEKLGFWCVHLPLKMFDARDDAMTKKIDWFMCVSDAENM